MFAQVRGEKALGLAVGRVKRDRLAQVVLGRRGIVFLEQDLGAVDPSQCSIRFDLGDAAESLRRLAAKAVVLEQHAELLVCFRERRIQRDGLLERRHCLAVSSQLGKREAGVAVVRRDVGRKADRLEETPQRIARAPSVQVDQAESGMGLRIYRMAGHIFLRKPGRFQQATVVAQPGDLLEAGCYGRRASGRGGPRDRLTQAALLVFAPTAARARVVAANTWRHGGVGLAAEAHGFTLSRSGDPKPSTSQSSASGAK